MKKIEDREHHQGPLEYLPTAHNVISHLLRLRYAFKRAHERESTVQCMQDLLETSNLEARKDVQELILWYVSRFHT